MTITDFADIIAFIVVFALLLLVGWLINREADEEVGAVERTKPLKRINPCVLHLGNDERGNPHDLMQQTDGSWHDLHEECVRSGALVKRYLTGG